MRTDLPYSALSWPALSAPERHELLRADRVPGLSLYVAAPAATLTARGRVRAVNFFGDVTVTTNRLPANEGEALSLGAAPAAPGSARAAVAASAAGMTNRFMERRYQRRRTANRGRGLPRRPRPRVLLRERALVHRVGLGGDHRPVAGRVRDALLDPREAAVEHGLRGRVVVVVVVGPQLVEEPVDARAGLLAEQVRELEGLLAEVRALGLDRVRVGRRRRDRVQLRADVDDPPEERLLLLELGLPAAHRVERRACQLARVALDEAQVRGQRAELVVGAGLHALPDGQAREPARVELARADRGLGLGREVAVALEDLAGDLKVLVDCLAGDQQVHDLR